MLGKDTLSARGWPPWEAASTGRKGTVTPPVPVKRWSQLASWLGGWWRAVAVRAVRWLCACGWGTASFPWCDEVPITSISSRMTVTRASACMWWWGQQPWWEQAGSCHATPGAAAGQWLQPPLQEGGVAGWGDADLTLACNRLTITCNT